MENPFKLIEPDVTCPPEIKEAVFAEIEIIRNSLQLVELFTSDLFSAVTGLLSPPTDPDAPNH